MKTIKYQLYLLQLESYEIKRYWKLLFSRGFYHSKTTLRNDLDWTNKIRGILTLSLIIYLIIVLLLAKINLVVTLIAALIMIAVLPVLFTISLLLMEPFDYFIKRSLIQRAKREIAKNKGLIIIGVAGSYGKTTMKSVLEAVLTTKYEVMATPESINTPVGIARWILENFNMNKEIMIVEMGEHYKGDIAELCAIVKPNIAVITGINEAHLERLGTIKDAIETIFEIAENSTEDALIVLNMDDKNVVNNYQKFIGNRKASFYSYQKNALSDVKITNKKFDVDDLKWKFDIDDIKNVQVGIMGEYILGDLVAAYIVAKELKVSDADIKKGITFLEPVHHRLEPIKGQGNVLVIDDSYNGNPEGVKEAIQTLERFKERRKIYLTPGLVESGSRTREIHQNIGVDLSKVADLVILVRNSVTPFIEEGLIEGGFKKENIIWFETALLAHSSLGEILKPNDVILFQNDWGDQYL